MLTLKQIYLTILLLFSPTLLFGCSNDQAAEPQTNKQSNIQNISHTGGQEQEELEIEQTVRNQFDEIVELTSFSYNDEILMGIKVNQISQFNEQKIAKEVKSFIKREYPGKKATVSSDYKVFLEIDRLKEELINEDLKQTDIDKRFKEVKDFSKKPKDE